MHDDLCILPFRLLHFKLLDAQHENLPQRRSVLSPGLEYIVSSGLCNVALCRLASLHQTQCTMVATFINCSAETVCALRYLHTAVGDISGVVYLFDYEESTGSGLVGTYLLPDANRTLHVLFPTINSCGLYIV